MSEGGLLPAGVEIRSGLDWGKMQDSHFVDWMILEKKFIVVMMF